MSSDTTILNMTINGIVFKKQHHDQYHITYKNLNFTFDLKAYHKFTQYISELKDILEEHRCTSNCSCKEIEIPIGNPSLKLTFSYKELLELNDLFTLKPLQENILKSMEYVFSLN